MRSVKVLLKFPVDDASKPVAWVFATEYKLQYSILQADIRAGQGGRMIMDLRGEEEDIAAAVEYARSENVEVKMLNRMVLWDDEVCVHCGACTAVCAAKALSLDQETWELKFNNEKCVACEMCTHACPTGAMHVDFI